MFLALSIAEDQVDPQELVDEGLDDLSTDDLEAYRIDDMLFDKEHYESFLGLDSDRSALNWYKRLWPNGTIPFVFEDSISQSWRNKMKSWANRFNQRMSGCLELRLVITW